MATLHEELITYRNDNFPRLKHALKAAIAVVLTMLICMRLELRTPRTGMVSAVIVMLSQQSGAVIGRAFYRALGLCIGCFAGLTLICLFGQQPILFIIGLAMWVGAFTAGASYYKNFQSYGFVLSGYAASITAVPEWSNPYDISTNAIHVISEVVIGVTVGSLVSALIFPQRVSATLRSWRDNAVRKLLLSVRSATGEMSDEDQKADYIRLINDTVTIESLRTAAVFEDPELRLRSDVFLRLDRTFLHVITRIRAMHRARELASFLVPESEGPIRRIVDPLTTLLIRADSLDLRGRSGIAQLESQLDVLQAILPDNIAHELEAIPRTGQPLRQAVEMAGVEVYSVVVALRKFCGACQEDFDEPRIQLMPSIVGAIAFLRSAPIRSSGTMALISGIRTATAIGLVGFAWILSGWTNGFSTLISVAISAALFSSNKAPAAVSWQAFVGCLGAWVVGFVLNFFVFPQSEDATLACLYIGIAIFFGSYLNTFPKVATLGAGFCVYFGYIANPTNPAVYDPEFVLDRGFALLVGLACAAVAFSVILPREGQWLAKRYGDQIRRILGRATSDSLEDDTSTWIEPSLRDAIVEIMTLPNIPKDFLDAYLTWAFGALSIANAVVQLRSYSALHKQLIPEAWRVTEENLLESIATMAQQSNHHTTEAAIGATERALEVVHGDGRSITGGGRDLMFEMRVHLHSTRIALVDQLAALPHCSKALS